MRPLMTALPKKINKLYLKDSYYSHWAAQQCLPYYLKSQRYIGRTLLTLVTSNSTHPTLIVSRSRLDELLPRYRVLRHENIFNSPQILTLYFRYCRFYQIFEIYFILYSLDFLLTPLDTSTCQKKSSLC